MVRLFLMMGIPGAGKSTYLENHIGSFLQPKIISRDKIRFSLLKDGDEYFSKETEVFEKFTRQINNSLGRGYGDTIVDATHLNAGSRKKVLKNIDRNLADEVIVIWIKVPLETALERNEQREGRNFVPEKVIKNMYNSLTKPSFYEGIDKLWIVTDNEIRKELLEKE